MSFLIFVSFFILDKPIQVNNGLMPKDKPMTLVFEEDLVIPGYPDREIDWYSRFTRIEPGNNGDFYVVDPSEDTIYHIDKDGTLLKSFGGSGQGPDEFNGLRSFQKLTDGTARAFASSGGAYTLTTYNAAGDVVDKTSALIPQGLIKSMAFSPDGSFVFVNMRQRIEEVSHHRQGLLTADFKPKQMLVDLVDPPRPAPDYANPKFWTELISSGLSNNWKDFGIGAFGSDGRIYLARGSNYEISVWDSKMERQLLKVSKKSKPIVFSDERREKMMDSMYENVYRQTPAQFREMITPALVAKALEASNPPETLHPIFDLIPMADKGFAVITEMDRESNNLYVDLFNNKGAFIGSVIQDNLDLLRARFTSKYAYTLREINGTYHVIRYRYKLAPKS